MRTILAVIALSTGLIGCNYGKRNAEACEDWIEAMDDLMAGTECEGTDFSLLLQGGCESYEDSRCDISEYFTCLEDNTECNEESGEVNTEGWNDCVSLGTCE